MVCLSPVQGWRSAEPNENGERPFTVDLNAGEADYPMAVSCGYCEGCRLDRSRAWAVRCALEASLWDENRFITLTYAPEHLPDNGSLNITHWQKFIRSLKKRTKRPIRFFHCGEYGSLRHRPHYHAILFNFEFGDEVPADKTDTQSVLYQSDLLDRTWGKGRCMIGDATWRSMAYVARYIGKKVFGDEADYEYGQFCDDGSLVYNLRPEYITMSRRPGIGAEWYRRYKDDVWKLDAILTHDGKHKVPVYFDRKRKEEDPAAYRLMLERRREQAKLIDIDAMIEQYYLIRTKLKRGFEHDDEKSLCSLR